MATLRGPLSLLLLPCLAVATPRERPQRALDPELNTRKAEALMERANFVFMGTILKTGASNLAFVAAGPKTTLVRVDWVLQGSPMLRSLAGQVITVRSERSAEHKAGLRSTFFLDADTFGENVSGLELGRFNARPGDEEPHARLVMGAQQSREDQGLRQRMGKAEQVVQGRVISVEPAGLEEGRSEHAAQWAKATVEVETVLKGKVGTKTVTLFFPTSEDRMWLESPRFAVGDEGVFVLHAKPKDASRKAAMIPGLTALEPVDFQRAEQRERMQRLLSAK